MTPCPFPSRPYLIPPTTASCFFPRPASSAPVPPRHHAPSWPHLDSTFTSHGVLSPSPLAPYLPTYLGCFFPCPALAPLPLLHGVSARRELSKTIHPCSSTSYHPTASPSTSLCHHYLIPPRFIFSQLPHTLPPPPPLRRPSAPSPVHVCLEIPPVRNSAALRSAICPSTT